MKGMNKQGQQMTLGTIIAIVLGIAVLVFLIFGFSTGWNNLWGRVTQFGGGSNVDTIVQACALKCTGQSNDAYCNQERTVKFGEERDIRMTDGTVLEKRRIISGSCRVLAKDYDLGISECPSLCN